jgi:hypothetical protein
MKNAQVNQQGRSRGDSKDYPDVNRRSEHGAFDASKRRLQAGTSLTGQPP